MNDRQMVELAAKRAAVRLADGRTARLVSWKPRHRTGNYMRVEFPSGGRATVRISELVGILDQGKESSDAV